MNTFLKKSYVLFLFFAACIFPSQLSAQTVLHFPRVIQSPEQFTGIAVATTFNSSTSLTGNLRTGGSGILSITVTNPVPGGGTSNAVSIEVKAATADQLAPELTGISPNNGYPGSTVTAALNGTGFAEGEMTVSVSGSGVTAGPLTFDGSTLMVDFTVASGAAAGPRDVRVSVLDLTVEAEATLATAHFPPSHSRRNSSCCGVAVRNWEIAQLSS